MHCFLVCLVPSTLGATLPSPLSPQGAWTFRKMAYHPHKGVGMSAFRTGLSGGLASRSCPLGRALRCPLGNNLSGLVGYRLKHKLLFVAFVHLVQ